MSSEHGLAHAGLGWDDSRHSSLALAFGSEAKGEILTTLDKNGLLDAPFMPETFACCGRPDEVAVHLHRPAQLPGLVG
jgi:hypothetical protein